MVHVFSFRFLEQIAGVGPQVLRWLGWPLASGGGLGSGPDPSPGPKDPAGAAVFRAATEKLATSAAVAPVEHSDAPSNPFPEPDLTAPAPPADAVLAADVASWQGSDPAPASFGPAGSARGNVLSADEQAAFQAIAAMLGGRSHTESTPPAARIDGTASTDLHERAPRGDRLTAPRVTSEAREIFDLVPLGIVILRDRDPIFANRFLLDLLGVANLPAALASGRFGGIARRLSEETLGAEIIEVTGGGGAIMMIASVHHITWDDTIATLACLRPCAESGWKRIEEELRDAHREAERASALKSDFLAKVSHEIRTPLNAILGFAEVILDERFGPIGNARYKEYLKDIHASGALVMSLVNDLLDLSKIEAGKMDLAICPVDANAVVTECVSIMQAQAIRERVLLRLSLWPELPRVLADERSLRQIVLNLLSNAVKFNEPGGEVVIATALATSGQALLRVEDTGIGMSDAEIGIALEPFGRVAGTRPSIGTGLGLPLTKALVEANRARFSITSRKSEGTSIEIAFPQA